MFRHREKILLCGILSLWYNIYYQIDEKKG
nr:MAG TPA: holin [Caudoviricetes sp.]